MAGGGMAYAGGDARAMGAFLFLGIVGACDYHHFSSDQMDDGRMVAMTMTVVGR